MASASLLKVSSSSTMPIRVADLSFFPATRPRRIKNHIFSQKIINSHKIRALFVVYWDSHWGVR